MAPLDPRRLSRRRRSADPAAASGVNALRYDAGGGGGSSGRGAGRERRPGRQRLGGGDAIEPTAIQRGRDRQFVAKGHVQNLAALEAEHDATGRSSVFEQLAGLAGSISDPAPPIAPSFSIDLPRQHTRSLSQSHKP